MHATPRIETGSSPGDRLLPVPARVVLVAIAGATVLAWLFLALAHLHDRYNVNAVSGTFLALAERAGDGVLYPPFFDGQAYGGTRSMPIPVLLYALAMSVGGDVLAPAKLVDLVASAALVLLLVAVVRRLGASWPVVLGLASTVVASQVFLLAATGIRPEALPTALQLGAVSLIAFAPSRKGIVLAALLCALAIVTKVSALWAPGAIVLWLFLTDRPRLLLFATTFAAGLVALLAAFSVASEGRMATNLLGLGGAGLSVIGAAKAPLKAIELLAQHAQATFVLLPILVLGLLFVGRGARPTIFHVGLVAATAILLVAMADAGSDYNHLLDVVVLVPIVALEVIRRLADRWAEPRVAWSVLAAAVLVGSAAALASNAGSSLAATLQLPGAAAPADLDGHPFAAQLQGVEDVLSEDPYVNLARGERPTVADPFMLIRIARRDPALVAPLFARVEAQEFGAVVLGRDLDHPEAIGWYRDFAFGLPFYEAMRASYHLCAVAGDSFLYFPNARACPA